MKTLLVVKAPVEVLAGVAFTLFPSALFALLLGAPLDAPGAFAFRMFGSAIFAIGLACWLVRDESESRTARGLIKATLFYDVAFVTILLAARLSAGLSGIAVWPVVMLHLGLAIFSLFCLRPGSVVRAG
jgi:Kef-type K+ transport system membrane component KefB